MPYRVLLAVICGVLAALAMPLSAFASRATATPTAEAGVTCNGATQIWTVTWWIHVTEPQAVRAIPNPGNAILFEEIEAGGSRHTEPVNVPGNTAVALRIEYTDLPWDDSRIQTDTKTVTLGPCPIVLQPPPPPPSSQSSNRPNTGNHTGTPGTQQSATPSAPGPATGSQSLPPAILLSTTSTVAAVANQASVDDSLAWAITLSAAILLAATGAATVLIRSRRHRS